MLHRIGLGGRVYFTSLSNDYRPALTEAQQF